MCSLSVVTVANGSTVLTHNRDEAISRQHSAKTLAKTLINDKYAIMPIDPVSKGTWIGSNGTISAALLNGYQQLHVKKSSYSKSRGVIIPALLAYGTLQDFINNFSFEGIEPFTLIMLQDQCLMELGWDELKVHTNKLEFGAFHFYSSYTLYEQKTIDNRKNHMIDFLRDKELTADLVLDYHRLSGEDHNQYLNVSFTDQLKTVSLTQIILDDLPSMKYESLLDSSTNKADL